MVNLFYIVDTDVVILQRHDSLTSISSGVYKRDFCKALWRSAEQVHLSSVQPETVSDMHWRSAVYHEVSREPSLQHKDPDM